MNPSELNQTPSQFEKLLAGLARSGVDFAVVGGLAVILNGYPRLTLDADIIVDPSAENLRKLMKFLAGWGEGFARELKLEDFAIEQGAVRVSEDFDLDIFVKMNGKTIGDSGPTCGSFQVTKFASPILRPPISFYSSKVRGAKRTSLMLRQ